MQQLFKHLEYMPS